MSDSFDVKTFSTFLSGSAGAGNLTPLCHFPKSGGAQTILECYVNNGTGGVPGTVNLAYGTCASGGSIQWQGTIGTSFGTGGGTFPAASEVPLTITAPGVVPADSWLGLFASGTFNVLAQSQVTISYVSGR
jgi:hypothetical protein